MNNEKTKIYPADEETILYQGKIKFGIDKNRRPVYLELEAKRTKTAYFKHTIEHKKMRVFNEVSIMGSGSGYWGQITDMLGRANIKRYCIPMYYVGRIKKLWTEWHLNDLQPNCIHQEAFNCNLPNYDELAKIETDKCPKGYKYGSAWLIKPIPEMVLKEIIAIFKGFADLN